ncbi:hypothetical protein CGCA056_v015014 [Colletotrichum aenigma]|uniref:uncharacterized protein n=1 Tax=Colletotrichum aenigma TaxID=1215731 RepID=UPI001872281E|nr:uncharacterized protein CGCA056_v015014 [Colletotrichum aenigma]KAF5496789.1 hypothetical protein CGCA056_v015014 [Colletotrichum aenigma]
MFRQLSIQLDLTEETKIFMFYQGLKDEVKDEIVKIDRPKDFLQYANLAIKIDNRLFERRKEKGEKRQGPNMGPSEDLIYYKPTNYNQRPQPSVLLERINPQLLLADPTSPTLGSSSTSGGRATQNLAQELGDQKIKDDSDSEDDTEELKRQLNKTNSDFKAMREMFNQNAAALSKLQEQACKNQDLEKEVATL